VAKKKVIRQTKSGSYMGVGKKKGKAVKRLSRREARGMDLLVSRRRSSAHKRRKTR
jgi:hypothetical protein